MFSTKNLTFEQLERATRYLLEQRAMLCTGLPSAVAQLARHVRAHHPHAPAQLVPFVKLGGEQGHPFQRDEIARHFGARVFESTCSLLVEKLVRAGLVRKMRAYDGSAPGRARDLEGGPPRAGASARTA